jgi:hypothetical protein
LKNKLLYIAFASLFISCSKESELKLELSSEILSFKPNYSSARSFSSLGDTIKLQFLSSSTSFVESGSVGGTHGSFEGIDRLLLEQEDYRIGSDSLGISINYQFRSVYAEEAPTLHNDFLSISFSDSLNQMDPDLSLRFDGDTTIFILNNSYYSDSVFIADQYFYNVVASQGLNGMALYTNSIGLIGFTTSNNRTFQIIN